MDESLAELIPHQGTMCLLEQVVSWNSQQVVLTTTTHKSPSNPLRNSAGRLRALHLSEYGAQAMAVHGALTARAAGGRAKPGFLVSLRAVRLFCDFADDLGGHLDVTATCLLASEEGWQYAFSVQCDGELLAEGRAAVVPRPGSAGSAPDPSSRSSATPSSAAS